MAESVFTEHELAYLTAPDAPRLARIATVGADGTPHVVPSGFRYDGAADALELGGAALDRTKKFRDVRRSGRAAVVVDDLRSTDPWRPRGIEVRGRADAVSGPRPAIRVRPERIVSWGLAGDGSRSARSVPTPAATVAAPARLPAGRAALLVIDVQRGFVDEDAPLHAPGAPRILGPLERLIAGCRAAGVPVLYTRHLHRRDRSDMGLLGPVYERLQVEDPLLADGAAGTIHPRVAPREGETVIVKRRFSAFHQTDLELVLRGLGVDTLLLAGLTTENCVQATARDAGFRDLPAVVVSDACAAAAYPDAGHGPLPAAEAHRATLALLAGAGTATLTVDQVLAELAAAP